MSAPVVQSFSSATLSSTSTSLTITAPSGIADDDLLVALITTADAESAITSSGWTLSSSVTHSGGSHDVLYKVASSESGNYTFSWSGNSRATGFILRIEGADTTTPIAADQSTTGTASIADPPASGTVTANDFVVITFIDVEGKSGLDSATAPSGHSYNSSTYKVQTTGGGNPSTHCGSAFSFTTAFNVTSANPSTWGSLSSDDFAVSTILINSADGPTLPSAFQYWNGTEWVNSVVKYWNGTAWTEPQAGNLKYWNGTSWTSI